MISNLTADSAPLVLSPTAFQNLVLMGAVTDGRAGGTVLGRSLTEGGILVVRQRGNEFTISERTQGGVFVLNKLASCRNLKRIKAMNAGLTMAEELPAEPDEPVGQFLITNARPDDRILWLNWAQAVVAPTPAEKHLGELIRMNEERNPFLSVDHDDLFPDVFDHSDRSADGVI